MATADYFTILNHIAPNQVSSNHEMAPHVTFKCGGPAYYYCTPTTVDQMQQLIKTAHQIKLPVFIIGGGSNIVFRDQGFPGLVLSTSNLNHIKGLDNHRLRVEAGVTIEALSTATLRQELHGFEWAGGLPGTVGGGIFMNARCYGSCFASLVNQVTYLDEQGSLQTISLEACQFDYKHSIFQHHPWTIISAELQFQPGDPEKIRLKSNDAKNDRIKKHQFDFPSAGCIFKNIYSENKPAGQLIEACGLKGKQLGHAKVYEHHANFIVNTGQCTADDVEKLMLFIKKEVALKTGFQLEPEIRFIS